MDDYKIVLRAVLDANAKDDIQNKLNNLKDLSIIISKATLSPSAINDIKTQLSKNGIDLKLVFGNKEQIINEAKKTGERVGQQINQGISRGRKSSNSDLYVNENKINTLLQRYQVFYDKNTASHLKYGRVLKESINELSSGSNITIKRFNQLSKQLTTIQNRARQTGKLGLSFFDSIASQAAKFTQWFNVAHIVMTGFQKAKEIVDNVKELDEALTNISYTMDVTDAQLKRIGNRSLQTAKDLHTSASDVLGAVKLYANAKETEDTILAKARPAIMLSNVTGFSGEESAKYLQTIMNQFDLTQDDLMMISDTIQSVSENIAHDFSDGIVQINEAISTSGEVARAAGMDLSEYSSIIGVLVENTGLQGSQLGNAMKSIITRTTKAGKILGIDEGEISKAEEALRNVGIEVRKSDGEFREFDDTMAELAQKWDSLTQVEQSEVSFQLAGTRQTSILKSLLKNWEEVETITAKANNSGGTTMKNQEKAANSLQGKLKELSATWEKIGDNALSSSLLKDLTDTGIFVSELIEKFGLLKTAIAGIGIYEGFKHIGSFTSLINDVNIVTSAIKNNDIGNIYSDIETNGFLSFDSTKEYAKAIDGLNAKQATYALTTQHLTRKQQEQVLVEAGLIGSKERIANSLVKEAVLTSSLSDVEQEEIVTSLGLAKAEGFCNEEKLRSALASTALSKQETEAIVAKLTGTAANTRYAFSFDVLTASIWANIKAMGRWLVTNPVGWAIFAATAIGGIIGLVDLLTTTVEENNKVIEETTQKIDEQQQAIDDLNDKQKSATDTYKEYASLMSKSNAYGLTISEKEQLLSLSKDLVDTYGLETEGIDSVTGAYKIGTDAINKYVDALRAERNMKLSEQSEEREKRVKASIDNAKKYQNQIGDTSFSDKFKDLEEEYKILISQKNTMDVERFNELLGELQQRVLNRTTKVGLSKEETSQLMEAISNTTLNPFDILNKQSGAISQKLSNTVKSIIKDVFADIAVNSGDMLDDGGESLLTKLLEPYLTNVDWDNFDKDDFEGKVQNFITQASDRLSSVSAKLDTSQKDIANGNINLDGYKKFYSTLQEEVALLDEMRQQDVISEESYNNQLSQIQQEITSNLGLAMTDISNTFAETDAQSKTRFESIANEFISLENQFKTGSITSIEYLDALTSKIENMDFTSVFQNNKEGAQEFFSSLTANVSTILEDTMTQFETGSLTVTEYGDRLADFAQQQKALAKNAIEEAEALGITGFELENIKAYYEKTSSSIDDAIAKWEELRGINLFLDENASFLQEGITINTDGYQNFANDLYNQFSSLSSDLQNEVLQNMQTVQGYANVTSENLLATMQDSVGATRGLAEAIAQGTAGTLSSVVNNGGEVLSALGDAIQAFTYTISFEPKSIGTMDTPVKIGDNEIFSLKLPFLSYDIKGSSTGNFGEKLKNLGDSLSAYSISMTSSNYGGGKTANNGSGNNSASSSGSSDKDKSGGGSSKEKDPEKEREEQAQKELEALKAGLDARKEVIEKYKESIDITDFGLDIAEEKDFALRTDLLNSKLSQVTAYGQAMRKEFERVSKIVPKTADQAEALTSQLSTLGNNMRDNVKTLRETQIALQQLKINAVTTSAKDNMDDMQTELSRLEKRIGLLNDDNKNEYKYTNKILNMETLLPTNAEMTGRRKNRSRADQSVIRAEEETQNVLNDMYQEQIKKNENLREDERQALLDAMSVMRNDMVINMQNASSDYVNYGNEVINTTNTYTKTVTDTVNSMNLVLPKPDTSKFAEACNEVEKMISNLGKGVSYEITPKSDGRGGGDAASLLRGNKKTIIKNVADGQLGVPYLWGGVTPGAGLDCSGLTQYVYRSVGVNIPRIADDQLKSGVGTRVDTRNLQVGDQLFFGDGKEASHTGIYVGNGMMIHAPSTGDVVKYSNINSEYYQSRLMGAKRYALGTPSSSSEIALVGDDKEGKLNKIRPELIVGKNGVRLAGQNGAEFVSLESGDQVIPYEKTKQILQRSDVSTPRYASGTVSPGAIASYIKQKYPQVTDAAIAGLLANIQQESSFVVDAKTIEAYGSGSSRQIARWGLFQLDDERIPGWSNIVQNGTWQQQIDRAFQNGGYNSNENSGMGGNSNYNVWNRILTNSSLNASETARLWDKLFERSDGKSRDTRATNAEGYYKKLLSGTLENTDALTANTNALQEELDPIKQAVAEINKYPKSFEDGIQKLINPAKVRERELAFTEDMTKANKQIELFNIYKPIALQAAQDGTAKYEELLKQYLQYLDDVDNGVTEYSQEIVDAYNEGLSDVKDSVMDVEDTLINVKNDLIDAVEKRIDKIDTYINDRNFYKDWDKYGDNEYKATLRKIQQYDQLLQEGIITQKEYLESIESLKQDAISLLKEDLSSSLDKYMSDVNEYKDKKIEEINFDSSKASSRQTLLQAHYDLINSIAEEQHTINNELEKSKTMYEYLNEDTRKLLFNQDDYNKLMSELNSISAKANKLQDEYLYKISHAQKEDLDEITSQYQMQYDMLMKQYEVEKARLEVTKKQQQLNNVLKERNVRMFIDGQWKWVANTEQVQNAKTELADAEFQVQQAKNSKLQQTKLNSYQTIQDRNTTRINYIESDRDRRQEEVDSINEILDGDSIRSMAEILQDFADSDFPEVRDLLYKIADKIGYEKVPYSNKVDYMAEILNAGTEEQAVQLYKMRSEKLDRTSIEDELRKVQGLSTSDILALLNTPYDQVSFDGMTFEDVDRYKQWEAIQKIYSIATQKGYDLLTYMDLVKDTEDDILQKYKERQNNTDYMDKILNAKSVEEVYKNNTSRNEKIDRDGLNVDKLSNDRAIQQWKDNLMANNYLQQMYDAKTLKEAIMANKMRNVKIEALDLDAKIFDDADIEGIWNEHRKNTDYTLKIKNSATVQEALDWNHMRTSKIMDFGLDAPIFTDDEIRALFEQGRLNEINQITNEVSPAMESLQDNDDFWQKSKEILKENSEGVNDALISLLEESIPNFKELLGKSAACIVEWVKQVTQENIDDETDYLNLINNATSFSEAMRYNDLRNAKMDRLGLTDGKLTEDQIKEIVGNNQQAFANQVASETTYITTQLEEASDFWEKANELLKDNSEGVNDALIELLKNTIPNFEDLLDASANAILDWVKTITQKKIVANTIVSVTDDKSNGADDSSVNHYATGTDYTQAGDAWMGEKAWELFLSKHGEFTPITRPTFANIPSGGVVFNQEQMSNVRKLWDLSNQNITNYTKYMTKQQPQTIDKRVDQSIKINGMNVDTTNGKEFVEAVRRFVSIH